MKKFAKVLACVLALTMLCSFAFAGNADDFLADGVITGYGTDEATGEANGWLNANGFEITDAYGVSFTIELSADELADEEFWIGGGFGVNSTSTGWLSFAEWGKASGEKPISIEDNLDGTTCTIKWVADAPIFTAEDTWCQFWIQAWGGTMTVTGADILGADGNPLGATVEDAPADSQPATGDATSIVALALVAVVAMGGVVVCSKKRA